MRNVTFWLLAGVIVLAACWVSQTRKLKEAKAATAKVEMLRQDAVALNRAYEVRVQELRAELGEITLAVGSPD